MSSGMRALPGLPGCSSYNSEDVEEAEALNNTVEEDMEEEVMFKVTRRANRLLDCPDYAGLPQKQQIVMKIAMKTQLVAA